MRHIMTRHTKDQELEGQAVLQLPNKTVTNVPGELAGQLYHALKAVNYVTERQLLRLPHCTACNWVSCQL